MQDRVGQQFGSYRLVSLLGQGGFADVYLAQHLYLERQAAIKILQTRLSQQNQEAFLKEARTIADLIHPNIIRVLDFGVESNENVPFLVMEYAPHGSLRQRYPQGNRLHLNEVIEYVMQVASALQYAHERKIVHRDVKPENMLLGQDGQILLSDFGIAVISQTSRSGSQDIHGTVAYMAPEQLRGRPQSASDQYALAMTIYELLCGELPFRGSFAEVGSQHLFEPVPPLKEKVPLLPTEVETVIMTALSKDPLQRFGTIQAFAHALRQASTSSSTATASSLSNAMTDAMFENPQVPPPPPGYIPNIPIPPPPGQPGMFDPSVPSTSRNMGQQVTPSQPARGSNPSHPLQGSGIQNSGGSFPSTYGQLPLGSAPRVQQTPQIISSPDQSPTPPLSPLSVPPFANNQTTINTPISQNRNIPNTNTGMPLFVSAQNAATDENRGVPPSIGYQPKKSGGHAAYIAVIVVLVLIVVSGGVFWAYSTLLHSSSTPATTNVVQIAVSTPSLTATANANNVFTPIPTSTALPTAATTPSQLNSTLPCPVTISSWTGGSQDWVVHNGILYNDGTNGDDNGPTKIAPCLPQLANYGVEAKIQVTNTSGSCFGIVLRASSTPNGWQGYKAGICIYYSKTAFISVYGDNNALANVPFSPDMTAIHTYRVEVKDNSIKFFIDGTLVDTATDNRLLTTENGQQIGLYSNKVQLQVTSFQVVAV